MYKLTLGIFLALLPVGLNATGCVVSTEHDCSPMMTECGEVETGFNLIEQSTPFKVVAIS